MCNHTRDDIPAFFPHQMLRSYNNAVPVFKMLGVENNISYQLIDRTHGYWPEDRAALLGWFNLHLKGIGDGRPTKEVPFKILADEQLMVYTKGKRDPKVVSIGEYCERRGTELRSSLLSAKTVNIESKKKELQSILRITESLSIKKVYQYSNINGWDR